jgi:CO/xanthine dehydrogenase Mo-binding subunit
VGRSVPRQDGVDKVTGSAQFLDDLAFPGLLHATVLRSTQAHARITPLDTAPAEQVDGVWTVVTGAQVDQRVGEAIRDHRVLARNKVRFVGEPVAVVIARDRLAAARGAEALQVAYEPLPAVLDVDEAQAADAPLIHEDLGHYPIRSTYHPQPGSNVYHRYRARRGDVAAAMAAADHVVEGVYGFPHIAHVQLEPHGAVALWRSPSELTVWSSAQSPHLVRHVLADQFDLPLTGVQVIVPYLGGGFGGKSDTTLEPLIAAAARHTIGRPVRLVLSREEMFYGSVLGRGCRARIRSGHDSEGRFLAETVTLSFSCGAYGEYGINVVEGAGHVALGTYRVPAFEIESRAVYTNTPFIGAFRGYGHPEVHWAMERHLDHVSDRLGLDPAELRRRNLLRPGDRHATGQEVEPHGGDLTGCLDAVADRLLDVDLTPSAPGRVRGAALCPLMKAPVMASNASSTATLRLNADGTVDLAVSGTEMGQGSWTALAQIAAEALEVAPSRVRTARLIDTALSPYEWQTVGSTSTWKVGQAIRAAATDLRRRLAHNAALKLGIPTDRVGYDGDALWDLDRPDHRVPVTAVALNAVHDDGHAEGGPAAGYGAFTPRGITWPDDNGQGNLAGEWTVGCQGAVVEVDLDTGELQVLRLITAIDVGTVVNPALARGQIVGAMVQGMGSALMEQVIYGADGRLRNAGLTDYKIPTPEDLRDTELEVHFLTTPFPDGPFGARCIGEHAIVSVPPAIANAVRNATGRHLDHLPLTADAVLAALTGEEGP